MWKLAKLQRYLPAGLTLADLARRYGLGFDEIIAAKGLEQITDASAIEAIVDKVIEANPGQVAEYQSGKDKLIGD